MIKLNPYLNFLGKTEEAFNFYKAVFGGEFTMLQRFSEVENLPDKEKFSENDLNKIMHISLPIGKEMLMGTDAFDNIGPKLTMGNNISLSLSPDSKDEADRLFSALQARGGKATMPMMEMFWGDYFGMVEDVFGVNWMINFNAKYHQ